MKLDLDSVWTPAYYGDEEEFPKDEKAEDISKDWVIFSTKNNRLLLKKGLHGKAYPISGQYKVDINNHNYKGNMLSELIETVVMGERGAGGAKQCKCPSLTYRKDLRCFAWSSEIAPLNKKNGSSAVEKGVFGEVTRRSYYQEVFHYFNEAKPSPFPKRYKLLEFN
ncbi:unnamed protein product [Hydatigera taeniaeformis]|uniref:Uncharacterized protein n=1 Tax=Hydatigena taeniaeformis TaxID=6205 RepID=A0A3P7GK23_HYDTA|nr:unnamed protein product [Hydatigera taeniaeformis]